MKRCLMTICVVVLSMSAASSQEKKDAPSPPKSEDPGPSLKATMKFIQDKLNDIGPVNYLLYIHDALHGNDSTIRTKYQITNVVADASACRVNYHSKMDADEKVILDADAYFLLMGVQDIVVMSGDQDNKEENAAHGHPELTTRQDPPAFVLEVRRKDKTVHYFDFFDEQMANRVAKALVHAVELCGGGSQPEPF